MMKILPYVFLFFAILYISGCGILGNEESVSPVIETELPEEVNVGQLVSFNIYHVAYNGCGSYSRHETVEEGNTITVTFYAKYPKGKICSDDEPTLETLYHFNPEERGEYYFKFRGTGPNEFLLDTLKVI